MTTLVTEKPPPAPGESAESTPDQVADLVLAALPSAIPCARLLVDWAALSWQLDRRCADAARNVVDELVAHTVATTGIAERDPLFHDVFDWLTLLDVRLCLAPRALLVEVWDSGVVPPDNRLAASPALRATSDSGYQLAPTGHRLVWCTVPALPRDPEMTLQLPRLPPRRVRELTDGLVTADTLDSQVLQQVLDERRKVDVDTKENGC